MGVGRADPIRWGIVATGNISRSFTTDLAELPDAEVVAVSSRSRENAEKFAADFGIPHAVTGIEELLSGGRVDVVYIGTPHPQHYAIARACLSAGIAVLCEKPVTLNARQAADLVEVARTTGTFFAEAMWMRTNPVVIAALDEIRAGAIGEPMQVLADFGFHRADLPERLLQPGLGGGALLDLGVYPATLAYAVLGRPAELRAVADLSDLGVDLNTAMVWRYDSGATAALTCGMRAQHPSRATISGSEGAIELPAGFFRPDYYERRTAAGTERVEVPTTGLGYHYEAAEVMRCVRAGLVESPLLPHDATIGVLEQLDTARALVGVRYPGDDEWLGA